MTPSVRAAIIDEAMQQLNELKAALDEIAREYDDKYSLCNRARHALALLRQRLIEIRRL